MPRRCASILLVVGATCAAAAVTPAQGATHAAAQIVKPAVHALAVRDDAEISSNWAGYAVTAPGSDPSVKPAVFSSVTARWVQPKARCATGRATYSAFWVGLGGYSETSEALEQIGTEANCSKRGKATYSMWYELVPAASVPIKLKVFPGNVVAASVTAQGTQVTLEIRDLTRRTYARKILQMASPDLSSAEWIAEAPSACGNGRCFQLPLANFGRIAFTHASATANEHSGVITDPAWLATPIQLVAENGSSFAGFAGRANGAVPSDVSTDGASFTIDYQAHAS